MPNTIEIEIDDGVARVWLNRPDVHNAFNDEVIGEITAAMASFSHDAEVRAVVLGGRGKSFSAGADLNWMRSMIDYSRDENIRDASAMATMFRTIARLPKPVIARVHGAAIGGGAGLVAAADIPIATERAKFGFSEVKLGIVPAVISPYVVQRVGAAARELFVTGARFDAAHACRIGLVNHVVVDESALDERIDAVIAEIRTAGPQAVSAAKQLYIDVDESRTLGEVERRTAELIADLRASAEGQDGMRAFLEKRSPSWKSNE